MENKVSKNKSSIMKDALVLFLITLVAGLALGYVYEITRDPIEKRKMEEKLKAYQTVFVEADVLEEDEELMNVAAELDGRTTIEEVNRVYNKNGDMIGYVVVISTKEGYNPPITIAMGYSEKGITGMEFLELNETPGFGSRASEPEFKDQFNGRNVDQFTVVKSGASGDEQINAVSAATISSNAIVNAVNVGISFLSEYATDLGGGVNE